MPALARPWRRVPSAGQGQGQATYGRLIEVTRPPFTTWPGALSRNCRNCRSPPATVKPRSSTAFAANCRKSRNCRSTAAGPADPRRVHRHRAGVNCRNPRAVTADQRRVTGGAGPGPAMVPGAECWAGAGAGHIRPADRSHTATIHHPAGCAQSQLSQLSQPTCDSETPHQHCVCGELSQLSQPSQHCGGAGSPAAGRPPPRWRELSQPSRCDGGSTTGDRRRRPWPGHGAGCRVLGRGRPHGRLIEATRPPFTTRPGALSRNCRNCRSPPATVKPRTSTAFAANCRNCRNRRSTAAGPAAPRRVHRHRAGVNCRNPRAVMADQRRVTGGAGPGPAMVPGAECWAGAGHQGQATRPADRSHTATIHHPAGCTRSQESQLSQHRGGAGRPAARDLLRPSRIAPAMAPGSPVVWPSLDQTKRTSDLARPLPGAGAAGPPGSPPLAGKEAREVCAVMGGR